MSIANIFNKLAGVVSSTPMRSPLLRVVGSSEDRGPEAVYLIFTAKPDRGMWTIYSSIWSNAPTRTISLYEIGRSDSRHKAEERLVILKEQALANGWQIDNSNSQELIRSNSNFKVLPMTAQAFVI